MKLVLDQELQKYNNLIDIMNDTLKAALSVIDGKSLINDKIEAVGMENSVPPMMRGEKLCVAGVGFW